MRQQSITNVVNLRLRFDSKKNNSDKITYGIIELMYMFCQKKDKKFFMEFSVCDLNKNKLILKTMTPWTQVVN